MKSTITVEGTALNAKLGPLVKTPTGEIWIDGLAEWPDELVGRQVRVKGRRIQKKDLPVFVQDDRPGAPQRSGIPVPPGTDLQAARRRTLLTDITWELIE